MRRFGSSPGSLFGRGTNNRTGQQDDDFGKDAVHHLDSSRGIGLAIAMRAARDGANVAIAAKTTEPHPKLAGTIYTAAEQVEVLP